MSVIEFFLIFTYIIVGALFLLVLLFIPVLGFIAGKKLNKCLTIFYLGYLMLSILVRIILIVAYKNVIFIVIGTLVIVSNLIAIRYLIKFLSLLKSLTDQEKTELLILQNGVPSRKSDVQYPQENINYGLEFKK